MWLTLWKWLLSTNTYDRTMQHEESYRRGHAEHEGLYESSLHLCDKLRQPHVSYISKYSYLYISCCNIIFFLRISKLYKQSHLKAAHCSNECKLTLKAVSFWLTQIWRKKSEIQTLCHGFAMRLTLN